MNFEIVDELNEDDLSYEFNTLQLVKSKDSGKLAWSTDSGCSCPVPFESFLCFEDYSPIVPETLDAFIKEVKDFPSNDPIMKQKMIKSAIESLKETNKNA